MTEITDQRVTQLLPRGTDRIRRRQQQAEAVVRAEQEIAGLASPNSEEKALILANLAAQPLDTRQERTRKAQRANAEEADREASIVTAQVPNPIARLRPGQQVDHTTARLFMKRQNKGVRDINKTAALAAGRAVLTTLNSPDVTPAKPTRFRKRAQHAAKQAKTAKK